MRVRFVAASAVAVGVALVPGVAMAAGGYGPNTPTGPADSPGGFSDTLTTKTVDSSGGNVAVAVPGGAATINAPAGAFSSPVQIEVTAPDLAGVTSGLSGAGFSGYKAVAGIGVKVLDGASGAAVTGKFAKPVTVTLTGGGLGSAGQKAVMFNSGAAATVLPTTLGTNSITITIDQDPNIAVIDSTSTAATVANATSTHTGIPTAGIELGAAALVVVGGGALMASRRRAIR